jgi:hypothetical protein
MVGRPVRVGGGIHCVAGVWERGKMQMVALGGSAVAKAAKLLEPADDFAKCLWDRWLRLFSELR